MRSFARLLTVLAALGLALAGPAFAATKTDYCYSSPAIGSSVKPNILIVLDDSESMNRAAFTSYPDSCAYSDWWSCSPDTSYNENKRYPGYAANNWWHEQDSNGEWVPVKKCTDTGHCDTNTPKWRDQLGKDHEDNSSTEPWYSGNYLNFRLMPRIDMGRFVLVGGKGASRQKETNFYKTQHGEVFEPPDVSASLERTGIMDDVADEARWGVMTYAQDADGGIVEAEIGRDNLKNVRSNIQNWAPDGGSSPAEALWSAAGYYAQETEAGNMPFDSGSISGMGPEYHNSDYSNKADPYDYNGSFPECADSFVLLISDGMADSDGNLPDVLATHESSNLDFDLAGTNSDGSVNKDYGLDNVAYYLRDTDFRPGIDGRQNVLTYPVYAFGDNSDARTLMQNTGINGAFEDLDGDAFPYYESGACELLANNDENSNCDEWDANFDGIPDAYFEAGKGTNLESVLRQAISAILERTSSGSTVATIATQTRSGGTLMQAYYLPQHTMTGAAGTHNLAWEGYIRALWTDPGANIRNDASADQDLVLDDDRILQFYFDTTDQRVKARLFPDDGAVDSTNAKDNIPDTCDFSSSRIDQKLSDDVQGLWEAGSILQSRNPGTSNDSVSTSERQIWFNSASCDSGLTAWDSSTALCNFNVTSEVAGVVGPYWDLNASDTPSSAQDLIKFLRGYDNPNGNTSDFRLRQPDEAETEVWDGVWKLGPVITGTPRVIRDQPVSNYADPNGSYAAFADSTAVTDRSSMVFVPGNDGMLHAFYPGEVEGVASTSKTATLNGSNSGKEAWAFIPENALPYLRWYAQMDTGCFIPTVDYRVQLIDAAIGSPTSGDISGNDQTKDAWRTLLVGTMGFGGENIDCDLDEDGTVETTLSSSIFVLDVTDPESPIFLWEKSLPDDSMTLTFPAVVRQTSDNTTNGDWYLVAGSGPMNPQGTTFASDPGLHVFDLKTGTLESTLSLTDSSVFADSSTLGSSPGVAVGEPLPLDPDQDDLTDTVVFGTYGGPGEGSASGKGALYRLRLDPGGVGNWRISNLADFDATGRPMFASVGVSRDPYDNLWLYGASGRFLGTDDQTTNDDPQYFFGVMEECWGDGTNDSADGCNTTWTVETDLVRVDGIETTGDATQVECRCAGSYYSEATYDSSNDEYNCPEDSELVVAQTEAEDYSSGTCGSGVDCSGTAGTALDNIKDSIRDDSKMSSWQGWYRELPTHHRVYSQPAVQGGLVNILSFEPTQDLCGSGGSTTFYSVHYQTGTSPAQPVFLSSSGYDESNGGELATGIDLGEGVPPLGEGFASMPGTEEGQVKTMTQTSTGQVSSTTQQGKKMRSGILYVREP